MWGTTLYKMQSGITETGNNIPDQVYSSRHTGGAQFLLCDGSVRFVSENVDNAIWRGVATRAGGEVLGDF